MLIMDTNMRLAKMLEALLKASKSNREETLREYIQVVLKIDAEAFADILKEIKCIDEHNHSLEEELKFLEGIEKTYDQLLELQSGFKSVCEKYGELNLELSDLSILNIDYIRDRINAIKGYLTNLRNIEVNKERIGKLTEQLVEQEKKRDFVSKRLLELENSLRENFTSTEGRMVSNGKLVPTSVVAEYEKIDLDFVRLLSNIQLLEEVLSRAMSDKNDALETLKTAEICYNSVLTAESKQFLEDTKKDYLKAEYRLTMIKILKLLSQQFTEYDDVRKKREDLLELIEYRFSCLKCLGVVELKDRDLDPFYRTKVREQLDIILTIVDSSKDTSRISSQISELVKLTEEMVKQKTNNQIVLADTRKLIEQKIGMSDIDITGVSLPITGESIRSVLPNQVCSIKAPVRLNLVRSREKADGVIGRVYGMMNRNEPKVKTGSYVLPELVIVPNESKQVVPSVESQVIDTEDVDSDSFDDELDDMELEDNTDSMPVIETTKLEEEHINDGLFETVAPFSEPIMFSDRSEESAKPSEIIDFPIMEGSDTFNNNDLMQGTSKIIDFPVLEDINSSDLPMMGNDDLANDDSFWVTQSSYSDEQIGKILSLSYEDNNNNNKVRKKAA